MAMPKEDITGRDEYIIVKSLALAMATANWLPPDIHPVNDRDDMLKLLKAMTHPYYMKSWVIEPAESMVAHLLYRTRPDTRNKAPTTKENGTSNNA
jgi:hypothetical protein